MKLVSPRLSYALLAALSFGALLSTATPASAADACEVVVESNDAMKFDKTAIEVPKSCAKFTVNLKHVGKLPKAAMGHNWVLTKAADAQGAAADGIPAGVANEYVKPGDARVIAFTKLIGGGESTSVTFEASKLAAGQDYTFFCSFPGHSFVMKGSLKLGS